MTNANRNFEDKVLFGCCIGLLWACCLGATSFNTIRGAFFVPLSAYRTIGGTLVLSKVNHQSGKGGGTSYQIEYAYRVGAATYTSNQVTFGSWGARNPNFAQSYTNKYPVGKSVQVFYKADEPSFAVLEPQVVGNSRFYLVVCLVVPPLCLGGIGWALWRRKRRW